MLYHHDCACCGSLLAKSNGATDLKLRGWQARHRLTRPPASPSACPGSTWNCPLPPLYCSCTARVLPLLPSGTTASPGSRQRLLWLHQHAVPPHCTTLVLLSYCLYCLYCRYYFTPLARGSAFCGYVSMLSFLTVLLAYCPCTARVPQVQLHAPGPRQRLLWLRQHAGRPAGGRHARALNDAAGG